MVWRPAPDKEPIKLLVPAGTPLPVHVPPIGVPLFKSSVSL